MVSNEEPLPTHFISIPDATTAIGPYSRGAVIDRLIFTSGELAADGSGGTLRRLGAAASLLS